MPHVAIEIVESTSPSAAQTELETALVQACTVAVHDGDCALERDRPEMQRTATAIVRWGPGERDVRIEFREQSDGEPRWQSRSLSFGDADERIERWRTAGLTIASLAGAAARAASERQARSNEEKKTEPAAQRSNRAPPSATARPKEEPKLWIDIGALGGTALDTASPRLGVWADVGVRLGQSPIAAIGAIEYAGARGDPSLSVQWLGGSVGLGVELGSTERGLVFEASAMLSLQRHSASSSDGTRADSGGVFGYGGRARAIFVWELGVFSPLVGAEGWVNAAPIQVVVHDQYAGSEPRGGGAVILGARARLD